MPVWAHTKLYWVHSKCVSGAVAHVLEGSTDKWWRFDDETVTAMPDGPIGEKADHGIAATLGPSGKKVAV